MATFQTTVGNVCADRGDGPGNNKWTEWPERNGKKADKYYSLHIASNATYGKGVMYIEAQFRNPFHADVASRVDKGQKVSITGELTGRKDDKGRTWLSIPDAKFVDLPPKKMDYVPPNVDEADDVSGAVAPEDGDLPF